MVCKWECMGFVGQEQECVLEVRERRVARGVLALRKSRTLRFGVSHERRKREWIRMRENRIVYTIDCECHTGRVDELHWVTEDRLPAIKDAWMFHPKSEDEDLPKDECGAVLHMLIDPRASLHAAPADLLHR